MLVELLSGLQISLCGSCTGVGPAELLSRAKLGKVKLLFLTEDSGGKKWPFSHQPCKVNFAEHLSVPERMEKDTDLRGWFWFYCSYPMRTKCVGPHVRSRLGLTHCREDRRNGALTFDSCIRT